VMMLNGKDRTVSTILFVEHVILMAAVASR